MVSDEPEHSKKVEEKRTISSQQTTEIFNLFIMALIWSFGAPLHSEGRDIFSGYILSEINMLREGKSKFNLNIT